MDYEQKYKEALERASMLRLQNPYDTFSKLVEQIFPELEESEDEKMKRLIISTITLYWGDPLKDYTKGKQLINWIEKQWGNNVKPKFEVGDYIKHNQLNDYIAKMVSVNINSYDIENIKTHNRIPYVNAELNWHLWTLADAKDGDILVYEDKPFIFKGLVDTNHPKDPVAYCGIDECGNFIVSSLDYYWTTSNVKPANKEQRDFLFKKMNEADYKWDDEKKELIPIK